MQLFLLSLFVGVYPVHAEVADQKYDGADCPGDGIGGEDNPVLFDYGNQNGDIADAEDAPGAQHDKHRDHGSARTAEDRCNAVGQGQHTEEHGLDIGLAHSYLDGGLVICEEADQGPLKEDQRKTDHLRHHHTADQAKAGALLGPVKLLCAQVLADEGGQGHGKAGNGQEGKAL